MRISLNKVKEYVQIPDRITDTELISLIGSRLVEIEEVIDLAPRYQGIYIVKVISCDPIPDTHLHLCQIDAGAHNQDFHQLDNGLIQVVCGAPNVHAGMMAVWITPGAIVPETYGNEDFKLSVRKLRGYESNGMLAGADELGLDNEHKAIAEIDPKTAQPGSNFAEVFGLNDIILDVENKSLTHRPDCFGLIGFAREVAGILGIKFIEPEVFTRNEKMDSSSNLPLEIKIQDSTLCPRYSCAVFDLQANQPSKYLTKSTVFLAKSGMRAIDPMVDLTNIIMLETGQPLHAFDYDKLVSVGGNKTPEIIVRAAKDEEELQLLDGKVIKCIPDDILITSSGIPVALAGAMGGKNTEVDASTKRIILESATFSLYNLRKTQMAHGIFSEAITRFTKGQPAAMTMPVLNETIRRLGVEVLAFADDYPNKEKVSVVKITTEKINRLLGTDYDFQTIAKVLEDVGFKVKATQDTNHLEVTPPAWRTDIHIPEDIIEEVGRLLGYDNIPLALPNRMFVEAEVDPLIKLKSELRGILSNQLAMNELLTYSFISRTLIEKVDRDPDDCYEITNSISPELQCFRPEIVPSLLDKVRENLKSGHRDFCLYEMNQIACKSSGLNSENTPNTKMHLGIVNLGDYYDLKAKILALFGQLKLPVEYIAISPNVASCHPYLEPKRSVEVIIDGQVVGAFGEVKVSVLESFKLQQTVSAFELSLDEIVTAPRNLKVDPKISRFPFVERDITLRVDFETPFGRIDQALEGFLSKQELVYSLEPISIYQGDDKSYKNLSFRIKFSDPQKTLNSNEIADIMNKIIAVAAELGGEVI